MSTIFVLKSLSSPKTVPCLNKKRNPNNLLSDFCLSQSLDNVKRIYGIIVPKTVPNRNNYSKKRVITSLK
jgi:hypothetical protein